MKISRFCFVLFLTFQLGSMKKTLGCKPKWMMLSLQLLKTKGQCDKFLVIDGGALVFYFCKLRCLVGGYEHCGVYDWQCACCVWSSSWVSFVWCIVFWRKSHVWR